jgi:hypothetical protein
MCSDGADERILLNNYQILYLGALELFVICRALW